MHSRKQSGQGLVEYIALTALIAIVSISAVKVFGSKVQRRLTQITNSFDRNMQQGLKSKREQKKDDDFDIGDIFGFPDIKFPKPPRLPLPSFDEE